MTTLADLNSVNEVIQYRSAADRWIVTPTIISRSLGWPIQKAAESLESLCNGDEHRLKPVLSSYCTHCDAQISTTHLASEILSGQSPTAECRSCYGDFRCSIFNTFIEYHIEKTFRNANIAGKEVAGDPSRDARR